VLGTVHQHHAARIVDLVDHPELATPGRVQADHGGTDRGRGSVEMPETLDPPLAPAGVSILLPLDDVVRIEPATETRFRRARLMDQPSSAHIEDRGTAPRASRHLAGTHFRAFRTAGLRAYGIPCDNTVNQPTAGGRNMARSAGGSDDQLATMIEILSDIRRHTRLLYILAWIGIGVTAAYVLLLLLVLA
jgi:hypothetical protein